MVTFWIRTVATEKALENNIIEILQTLQKGLTCLEANPTKFL